MPRKPAVTCSGASRTTAPALAQPMPSRERPETTPAIAMPVMTVARSAVWSAPAPMSSTIAAATVAMIAMELLSSVPQAVRKELVIAVVRPAIRVVISIAKRPAGRPKASDPE